MSELLLVERQGHICTLTMNRPEKRNSVNPELLDMLSDTLARLEREGGVRVAVLRGAGEEAFSSGFDIGRINERVAGGERSRVHGAAEAIVRAPFPVIAMIHGFCVGGGLELAVACDLRFASQDARLGITPAKLGLVYRPEGLLRFINILGVAYTKELFFTGRIIPASRALEMGLVNHVLPNEELAPFTYAFAEEVAQNAPLSVGGMKQVINHALNFQRLGEEDRAAVRELILRAAQSRDLQEGQRAFLEKRKPNFQGE